MASWIHSSYLFLVPATAELTNVINRACHSAKFAKKLVIWMTRSVSCASLVTINGENDSAPRRIIVVMMTSDLVDHVINHPEAMLRQQI